MKRYLLFIIENYYPKGGMRDFYKDYDTLEKCYKGIDKEFGKFTIRQRYWWHIHIYDTETRTLIDYPECLQPENTSQL
jgi:hypothetical protein